MSRRSFLAGVALVIAGIPACSVLVPGRGYGGTPERSPAPTAPTPTAASLFGVIPLPPAPTSSPTAEPILVRFGHWETGDAGTVLDEIVANFSRRTTNVVVRQEVLPFGAHFDRIQRGFAAGDASDAFVSSGAHFYRHVADGRLLNLLSGVTAAGIHFDDYWTDPSTRLLNGQVLGVPLWTGVELAFVNLDHIDQAGAVPPTDAWTWADLLKLARQLTVGKPGEVSRWGLLIVNDLIGGWGSFVTSNGSSWIDLAARKTTLDPAAVDALTWVSNAMLVHHVAPRPLEQQALTRGGTIDPFLAGDVSLFVNGSWEIPTAVKGSRFHWDVVRLPRAPRTDTSVSLSGTQPGCATRATRHPDETLRFLGFLLSTEAQRLLSRGKVRIPSLKSLVTDKTDGFGVPPPANVAAVAAAASNTTDPRFTTNWQPFRTALIDALDVAFNGRTDLSSAVRSAILAGDSALDTSSQ